VAQRVRRTLRSYRHRLNQVPFLARGPVRDLLGQRVTVEVIAGPSHALPTEQPVAVPGAVAAWAAIPGPVDLDAPALRL
jgi:hypothetical protein